LKKIFQIKNENYQRNIQSYLLFLNNKFDSYKEEVNNQKIEIFETNKEIQKLMINIITKAGELELHVNIRN
jgi:hypothetical protein